MIRPQFLVALALSVTTASAATAQSVKAYVANYATGATVTVIDASTRTVAGSINTNPTVNAPATVALSPDGTTLYAAGPSSADLVFLDTTTNSLIHSLFLGISADTVAVNPAGTRVYVSSGSGTVVVVNTSTRTVVGTIAVGSNPRAMASSPDGSKLYVANSGSGNVSVIDTATNTVTAAITVNSSPYGIGVTPDGTRVYVTNRGSDNVSVINAATNTVTATIAVGGAPTRLAVSPDGSKVYVTNSNSNTVSVISTATNTVTTTVAVGSHPVGVAVAPDGSTVWVANLLSNSVSVIDAATNTVLGSVTTGTPNMLVVGLVPPGQIRVDPATLSDGRVGVNYSRTLTTVGNTGTCTFAVTAGSLPPGLTLTSGGLLSGTPTADGSYSFTVTATDPSPSPGNATTGSRSYTLNVNPAIISISPVALATPIVAAAYNQPIVASGGTAPYTFSITSGTVPPGLALSPGGVLSGTPTASGTFNFTVSTTDTSGGTGPFSASRAYTLTVYPEQYGVFAYVANDTSGTVSVIRVSTNTVTGTISIVPGNPGAAGYAVAASPDGSEVYVARGDDRVFAIDTSRSLPGSSLTSHFPQGSVVSPDGTRLYISGSSRSVTVIDLTTWTVLTTIDLTTGGSAPRGISISPDGAKLYVACSSSNVVKVIDTATNTVTATITVGSSPFDTLVSPDGSRVYVANSASNTVSIINPATNTVTGSIAVGNQPWALELTPDGSKLFVVNRNISSPGSVSIIETATNSTLATLGIGRGSQALAVTPDGSRVYVPSSLSNTVTVIDANANSILTTIAMPFAGPDGIAITPVPPPVITFGALAAETVAVASAQSVTASGGTAPYTFALTSGALPPGLTLQPNGSFSGTPTGGGVYNFTITATDANTFTGPYTASQSFSLTVNPPAIALSPASLPAATVASAYAQSIVASAGTPSYSYALTSGSLPAGLSFAADGTISGTPTAGGTFSFTIAATDSSTGTGPYTGSRPYTLTVNPPAIALPGSLPAATVAVPYTTTLTASGAIAPYTYAITSGALPAGLSLAADGTLAGTATEGGTFNITITATDSSTGTGPYSGSQVYAFQVNAPAIDVSPLTLSNGAVAATYAPQSFSATGGTAPYSFAITAGALPAGMTLSPEGTLSGTPTAGGNFNFTVTATDSTGGAGPYTGSRAYVFTVDPPAITLSPVGLLAAQVGVAHAQSISATGGVAPYTFAVTGGALPSGVTLSPDGTLSGTATDGGTFNVSVTATDSGTGSGPFTGTRAYTFVVNPPVIIVSPATLAAPAVDVPYSETITATGGTAPYTFAVTAGTLPDGLTLSPAGVLSGTPSTSGAFNVTITATDNSGGSGPYTGSRAYSDSVAQSPSTTTLVSSVNPSAFGAPVTFTATVTASATGTVDFHDGATLLGTAGIAGGVASFTTSALSGGAHGIVATYSGDGNYLPSSSAPLTQQVDRVPSTVSLTSSPNPSIAGEPVTFIATVSNGATGPVEFYDGTTLLGTATISGTTASFTSSLRGGTRSITAVFTGDTNYASSTSAVVVQAVEAAATTVTLTSSGSPSTFGETVTFTATLPAGATGSVSFYDDATLLGTASVSGGTASFSISSLSIGMHTITASYGGDPDFAAATSAPLTHTVGQPEGIPALDARALVALVAMLGVIALWRVRG